jgi:NADH-quinone oxidoreductase subunit B
MGELKSTTTEIIEPGEGQGFATTRFEDILAWAQKYSLFMYPFVTACCGMEFMAVSSPRYDFLRFGSEARVFAASVGPALGRRHHHAASGADLEAHLRADGGAEMGAGLRHLRFVRRLLRQLRVRRRHRQDHPCDVYVPGCPPRPEAVLDGLDAAAGQDPERRSATGDRQAAPRSRAGAEHGASSSSGNRGPSRPLV